MPLINVRKRNPMEDFFSKHATYDYGSCIGLGDNLPQLIERLRGSEFSLVLDLDVDRSANKLVKEEIDWFEFYSTIQSHYPNREILFGYEGHSIFTSLRSEDAYRTYALFPISMNKSGDTGEVKAQLILFAVTHKEILDTKALNTIIEAALTDYHKELEPT